MYIDEVKSWFETGDFPTQAQFYAWMEKIRWNDESIPVASVTGLQSTLNSLGGTIDSRVADDSEVIQYDVFVGYMVEKIVIVPSSNCQPFASIVGELEGGLVPIDETDNVTPTEGAVWAVDVLSPVGTKQIQISAIPSGSNVYFIKRKVF